MKDDVKICVSTRVDFFDQYYTVPDDIKADVDAFKAKVTALGEQSADAQDFEARFAAMGLTEEFTSLLPKCTPKPVQMTQEQKDYSKQVKAELRKESGDTVLGQVLHDVADSAKMELESELTERNRKAMIEDGVFDEYTRVTNAAEDVGLLAGLFRKKKKEK